MKRRLLLAAATLAAGAAAIAGLVGARSSLATQPENVDIAAGAQLYSDNCAACHGADLEGQDDWRSPGADGRLPAPPHDETGHTWHHSDAILYSYTALGGRTALAEQGIDYDSGMPGFADILSDAEIWNILAYIKSTWPDRAREVQAARSADE